MIYRSAVTKQWLDGSTHTNSHTYTQLRVLAGKERVDSVERSLLRQPPVACRAEPRQKRLQENLKSHYLKFYFTKYLYPLSVMYNALSQLRCPGTLIRVNSVFYCTFVFF